MKKNIKNITNSSVTLYVTIGVLILMAIVTSLLLYGKSLNDNVKKGQLSSEQIANIMDGKKEEKSQSASSNLGKTVEEGKTENQVAEGQVKQNNDNSVNKSNINNDGKFDGSNNTKTNASASAETKTNTSNKTKKSNTNNNKNAETKNQNNKKENTKTNNTNSQKEASTENNSDIKLQKPVEGNVIREFAKENLVFSETLKEWITHNGIDIQAAKTTVVQSAADGTVKTIKNDPRYGLTIVIEHANGLQTVYANLLSSEFVKEGEKVIQGQSIGTVGNSAVFESCDEPHLHFEVLKDSVQVDPNIYLK